MSKQIMKMSFNQNGTVLLAMSPDIQGDYIVTFKAHARSTKHRNCAYRLRKRDDAFVAFEHLADKTEH